MTNKVLVNDPRKEIITNKFYKCGDKLSKNIDGLYYFRGRVDTQVKIRGHRLEVEEINELLIKQNGVEEVFTHAYNRRKRNNNLELFTFIKSKEKQTVKKLFKIIDDNLPPYFKPSKIFFNKRFSNYP